MEIVPSGVRIWLSMYAFSHIFPCSRFNQKAAYVDQKTEKTISSLGTGFSWPNNGTTK